MLNLNDSKISDPIDFIPGQKIEPTPNSSNDIHFVTPPQVVPKKRSAVVKILKIILLIPIAIVILIIAMIIGFSTSHGRELNKLKNETTSIFKVSSFTPITYDCHDVEFRNTCYFELSGSDAAVESFLLNQGFSKSDTYGKGFQKGELYIDNDGGSSYSSFYAK